MTRVLFSIAAIAVLMLFPVISTAGQGVACASLVVIDGDTIKCDGQNMRLLAGVPRIEDSGARDRTPSRRPLVNVYLSDGREGSCVGRAGARMAPKAPH